MSKFSAHIILILCLAVLSLGCERITKPYPGTKGGKTISGPQYNVEAKANQPLAR
ncbi:MAG: hypothetical protein K1X79_12795 [Oligoflexia bacterium]|nr:hypothetical protein [Oligoflexia bacterium]